MAVYPAQHQQAHPRVGQQPADHGPEVHGPLQIKLGNGHRRGTVGDQPQGPGQELSRHRLVPDPAAQVLRAGPGQQQIENNVKCI